MFRDPPLKIDSGSMANQACLNVSVKILKVVAYLLTFVIVLAGGVISKGCVLFMTSQIRKDRKIQYCNKDLVSINIFVNIIYLKCYYVNLILKSPLILELKTQVKEPDFRVQFKVNITLIFIGKR